MENSGFNNNTSQSRFELTIGDDMVFADYAVIGRNVRILHVETPIRLRGKGAAGKLMAHIWAALQASGQNLVPICSYAQDWVAKHSASK